jgi:hypothetical protein
MPPTYKAATTIKGVPANLNHSTRGPPILLGLRRDVGPPIVDIEIYFPNKSEKPNKGFTPLTLTTTGDEANLNYGTSGLNVFLQQRFDFSYFLRIRGGGGSMNPLNPLSGSFLNAVPSRIVFTTLASSATSSSADIPGSIHSSHVFVDRKLIHFAPDDNIALAFCRFIFPFLIASHSHNDAIASTSIKWLKNVVDKKILVNLKHTLF